MSLPITDTAEQVAKQIEIRPNIVLEIDGYDKVFGSNEIQEYIRIGDPDLYIGNDWVIGGIRLMKDASAWVSFSNGTTTRMSQKLDPSKAQGSTVTSLVVSLIDKNNEVSRLVSPGIILPEFINRKCVVRTGFANSAYPQDYITIFRGYVQTYECGAGYINLILNNTEEKKRVNVISKKTAKSTTRQNYRSVQMQDIFYQNRSDITNVVTVTYTPGGVQGSEGVSVAGTNITVQIASGASTATQIKKAIENDPNANQLVDAKIVGTGSSPQISGAATLGIDTGLNVDSTTGFLSPADSGAFRTLVKIDSEVMEYTTVNPTSFSGITRATFGDAAIHENGKDISQLLILEGNPIDLALKLMLSGGAEFYVDVAAIKSFNYADPLNLIQDAIFFDKIDVEDKYGVVVGDKVTIENAINPGNNVTDVFVTEVGKINDGSYLVLSVPLINESSSTATVKIKSQFNVWPIGMKMIPTEVDVAQHVITRDRFLSTAFLELIVDDIAKGKDLIEQEFYLPYSCFSVPRKARSSVNYHKGPLATEKVVSVSANNVENAPSLKVSRSLSENFLNTVIYNYDYDPVTDRYLTTKSFSNDEALDQTGTDEKALIINSKGLRSENDALSQVTNSSRRLLGRYELGAEYIKGVKVRYGDSFAAEIGDISAVDYSSLQLTDLTTGTRSGETKLMEILNKVYDQKTGEVMLDYVNTIYNKSDRYGLISPASEVVNGSTTTKLLLKKSYGTKFFQKESAKWKQHIGQEIMVHNDDWSTQYMTVIQGFDNADPQGMLVSPPLPTAPGDGWIVRIPNYPTSTDPKDQEYWKLRYAFIDPTVLIISATSQTVFTVATGEGVKFYVGGAVRVHNYDYTQDGPEAKVIDVTGDQITIDTPTGFAINSSHQVDLIGFRDKQQAYRII